MTDSSTPDNNGTRIATDTVRFERLLPGPIETVWAWLTESDKRALWLAGGALPGREGEYFQLNFHHASLSPKKAPVPEHLCAMENGVSTTHCLLQFNPPYLLQMSWGENAEEAPSEVTIELKAEGDQVRLILTHCLLSHRVLASVAGGWHAHLAIMTDKFAGVIPPSFWPLYETAEKNYRQRFNESLDTND